MKTVKKIIRFVGAGHYCLHQIEDNYKLEGGVLKHG